MAEEPGPDLPELRASDDDRHRTADALRVAAGEGRLTVEELDERLDQAYAARTERELDALLLDLRPRGAVDRPGQAGSRMPVRPGEKATGWVVGILGGSDRRGLWRVGERCRVVNVMGGCDLDLNDAELAADAVQITVFSLMGGSTIRVPEGLNVEVSELAIMGGNDIRLGAPQPDPGGPTVHIRIVSIMGGTDIKRGRRVSRAERRRRKAERRHGLHGHPTRPEAPEPPEPPRLPGA